MAIQPNGTPYPVVGVLNNFDVYANEFYPVTTDFNDYTSDPFDSTKSPVGWEWKTFDMNTFTWTVADSTVFFVYTMKNNVYKLVFTKFEGSSTGNIVFNLEPMSASGIFESNPEPGLTLFPNPANDRLTVNFDEIINGNAEIMIFDMTGRQVYAFSQFVNQSSLSFTLPESGFGEGLHFIRVETENGIFSSKFMVFSN
jgi:hypothetical protein